VPGCVAVLPETGTEQMKPHHWWDCSLLAHSASHRSALCGHGSTYVATGMTLQACLVPVPSSVEVPSEEGGTVPGQQMGRSSSSWETMHDHHVGLLSAAMLKGLLGFFMSVLRVAPKPAASNCSRQWPLPSIPHQWGSSRLFRDWRPV